MRVGWPSGGSKESSASGREPVGEHPTEASSLEERRDSSAMSEVSDMSDMVAWNGGSEDLWR